MRIGELFAGIGGFGPDTGRSFLDSETSGPLRSHMRLESNSLGGLTYCAEVSPAKTFPLPASAPGSPESDPVSSGSSCGWPDNCPLDGCCLRTFQGFLARIGDATSGRSSRDWKTAGITGPTGYWTASISESPSVAVACSLSAIVEPKCPLRFFLSPRAARGILRRAKKRGRELPMPLRRALEDLSSAAVETGRTIS